MRRAREPTAQDGPAQRLQAVFSAHRGGVADAPCHLEGPCAQTRLPERKTGSEGEGQVSPWVPVPTRDCLSDGDPESRSEKGV